MHPMHFSRPLGTWPFCKCRHTSCFKINLKISSLVSNIDCLYFRLAPSISSMLLSIWDVSVEALEAGDLQGLFNLSLVTAMIQTSPILFLWMLPQTRDQLLELSSKPIGRSEVGGIIFLLIMFSSMAYIIIVGILNIVNPGWAGES